MSILDMSDEYKIKMELYSRVCQLEKKSNIERRVIIEEFLKFNKIAYTTQEVHNQNTDEIGYNIILNTGIGQGRAQKILIVAHHDIVANAGGANDNSSGVSVLLELAKLYNHNIESKYELEFIF